MRLRGKGDNEEAEIGGEDEMDVVGFGMSGGPVAEFHSHSQPNLCCSYPWNQSADACAESGRA